MKRVLFLTPLALAAMAGCAPKPNQIQAGQWEIVSELRSIDIPGASPEMLQQARADVGRPSTNRRCFTAEQARDFLGQTIKNGLPPTCTFTDEQYAGGQMRLRVSCAGGTGGQPAAQLSLEGNFSQTTLNSQVTMERPNPTPNPTGGTNAPVRTIEVVRGRRIGECPAGEATPALPGVPPQSAPPPQAPPPGHPAQANQL